MKRSKHRLSNYRLLTCNMGTLVPIGLVEVLPGDTFQHSTSMLLRVAPMLAPVMHPVNVRIHHWFVPNRLVWDDWEDFITGGPDGNDASVPPTITTNGSATTQALLDMFGVPVVTGVDVSALPVRGYNMIFNEFYRDQDLVTERAEDATTLASIAWEKDYFTAARPWAQKGAEVTLPLGTTAPVVTNGSVPTFNIAGGVSNANLHHSTNTVTRLDLTGGASDGNVTFGNQSGLQANLAGATAVDVNDVRRAFALQRYAEARAKYGSRYTEYLRYLGIRSADSRLQRPEYLGGGKQTIAFSEVLVTADIDAQDPAGTMKGHGISAVRTRRYRRFFEEHGFVISLMSVRPKTIYMDSLHRKWSRTEREDYYQRELELIGQQEVRVNEVFMNVATGSNVFGYADRYREYREEPSIITGQFRNVELDFWHLARNFGAAPTLNSSFVTCDPSARIFADQTAGAHSLWCMANHNLIARRLVSRPSESRII